MARLSPTPNRNPEKMTDAEKLDKILALLVGNELNEDDKGLVGKVQSLGARTRKLEKFKDRAQYLIIGAAITGGYELSELIKTLLV